MWFNEKCYCSWIGCWWRNNMIELASKGIDVTLIEKGPLTNIGSMLMSTMIMPMWELNSYKQVVLVEQLL